MDNVKTYAKFSWDPTTLQTLLDRCQMSVKSFSDAIGMSDQVLYKYIRGEIQPPLRAITRIADFFCVPIDYLIGRCSYEQAQAIEENYGTYFMILRKAPYEQYLSGRRPLNSRLDYRTEAPWPYNLLDDIVKAYDENSAWDTVLTDDQMDGLLYAIGDLTDKEQQYLLFYYKLGHSLEESGQNFGVSRERARQVIAKAVHKLRHPSQFNLIKLGREATKRLYDVDAIEKETDAKRHAVELKLRQLQELDKELTRQELMYEMRLASHQSNRTSPLNRRVATNCIEELELSQRSYRCLYFANIRTIPRLKRAIETEELQNIRGLGKKSIIEIVNSFNEYAQATEQRKG